MEISGSTTQILGTGGTGQKPPPESEPLSVEVNETPTDTVTLSEEAMSTYGTGGTGQKPPPDSDK